MNTNTGGVRNKRIGALNRLKIQLLAGSKTVKIIGKVKNGIGYSEEVPLLTEDITRIKKEISILESRI